MENIYIISDVHGCYKTLLALIEQFPNKQNSKIVFVSDLIDKGKILMMLLNLLKTIIMIVYYVIMMK
ncbi:metallophosphoesterase [Aliarcobacter butzleri]|uniref:metallophosphoesterase n=1 Tax=Aliarcobacter butzleri TaxID=28197 RepID=UPI002649C570|nr:metallophosphoesterase [Aliarcobacter butzleri]